MPRSVVMPTEVDGIPVTAADLFPGWPFVAGGAEDDGGDLGGADAGGAGSGDPDGGDPAGEIDLEKVAADFEAEAIAGGEGGDPADADGDPEDGTGKGKGAAASASDPVDEFITKNYGGDRSAFVASLYESRTETRRLHDELQALKVEIKGKPQTRDSAAELKAAREADTEVRAIDQEMKDIAADHKTVQQEQLNLATKAQGLQNSIAALEAELPHIDDTKEYTKKLMQVQRERLELNNISTDFKTNEVKLKQNERDYRRLERDLKRVDEAISERLSAKERQEREEEAGANRTREHFATAYDIHLKPFGLDPKSEQAVYIKESVRTMLADYLQSQGDDTDGLDAAGIFKAVGQLVAQATKVMGLKPRAAAPAKPGPKPPLGQRPVVAPGRRPAAGSAPGQAAALRSAPRTSTDVLSDPELVRRRADAIFSAQGKAQARGRRGIA